MTPETTASRPPSSPSRTLAAALAAVITGAALAVAFPARASWEAPRPDGGDQARRQDPARRPQAGEGWLHLRFEGRRGSDGALRLDLPLALVETAAPLLEAGRLRGGRVRLEGSELTAVDLRALWRTVRRSRDGRVAVLEGSDGKVLVSREGADVVATLSGARDGGSARLRVPLEAVDALFTGEEDELNLAAALRMLSGFRGDLILATDDEGSLRIWVDETGPSE